MTTRHILQYGTTTFEYSLGYASRKTLGITVHPDCAITVVAPVGSTLASVEEKLKRRSKWIVKQQREFEKYLPTLPPRQYVSGETHLYLGKQYRLKITASSSSSVKLIRGWFMIETSHPTQKERVKHLLDTWYRNKAKLVFAQELEACLRLTKVLGIVQVPPIQIREMPKRWGSCTQSGTILLNPRLIQVRKDLIAYVITHELCHLQEHNHSNAYYKLLDRAMPDWEKRRAQLNCIHTA